MGFEKGNSTKVYFLEKNQLLTTIPRSLAQAYGFVKNSVCVWNIKNNNLVLSRDERFGIGHKSKIYVASTGQIRVTLPKQLSNSCGIVQGDTIFWYFIDNQLVISKKMLQVN